MDKTQENITPGRRIVLRALEYAEKNLTKIEVKPGRFMGNQKCYQNTRQELEVEPTYTAVSCLAFKPDGKWVNLHFVNKTVDGTFIDNTLGYQANFFTYYTLKEYTKEELDNYSENKVYPKIVDDLQDHYLETWFTQEELEKYGIGREHF